MLIATTENSGMRIQLMDVEPLSKEVDHLRVLVRTKDSDLKVGS